MNTTEEKQAFFDLYSGQEVIFVKGNSDGCLTTPFKAKYMNEFYKKDLSHYALLTPLEQITDEHAAEIATVNNDLNLKHYLECGKPLIFNEIGWTAANYDIDLWHWNTDETDKLRGMGYACRFRGKSVEELINIGWVKLKEK